MVISGRVLFALIAMATLALPLLGLTRRSMSRCNLVLVCEIAISTTTVGRFVVPGGGCLGDNQCSPDLDDILERQTCQ